MTFDWSSRGYALSAVVMAVLLVTTVSAVADHDVPASTARAVTVLGRFTTSYAHDAEHKSRAYNVELTAEAINGKAVPAGGTLSFNEAVGERTAAFGFAKSVVIRDGMIAEGMGGGACQVASTLHAAALLSGLEIVARAPHSRPSAYIRMGLDATVALGGGSVIDLKLKNSTSHPIVIHARATHGTLDVWIDATGASARGPDVSVTSEIVERMTFARVVERDKRVAEDTVRIKAFGIPGYRIKRTREIRSTDGTVRRDVRMDVYAPTNEIVQIAPSFDESRVKLRPSDDTSEVSSEALSDETRRAPARVIDPSAVRPVLVQLRPSTLVVLDNGSR